MVDCSDQPASLISSIIKMNSEARAFLKKHIEVYLEKHRESTVADLDKWIKSGEQPYD